MTDLLHRRVTHRFNPELGIGRVVAVHPRSIEVEFPATGEVLRVSRQSDVLEPVEFAAGSRARIEATGETVYVDGETAEGTIRLVDGREIAPDALWPDPEGRSLFDRLAEGDVDPLEDVALRVDATYLQETREADGLGSFLGGRIRLFPHQLHVAERATRQDPVRWLLADEVGLGKTVEACLILNHLVRTGRAARVLVVAPATLTVQWLGELWRKYHQVFVLVDDDRLADVEREYGSGFNPFDAYPRAIVSLDFLLEHPRLTDRAVEAGFDLLILDEAHHLRRPPGHPGNAEYRAVAPIAEVVRHVLLLTATPLEDDAHGFFRLLQLLRPDEFPEDDDFAARLAEGRPLPPCTSATRRADIGGLPPRIGRPIETDAAAWDTMLDLERAILSEPAGNPLEMRRKADRLRRATAHADALRAVLDRKERARDRPGALARRAAREDPRIAWLADAARRWRDRGDKTLVFVAHRETLEALRGELSRRAQVRVGLFHEDLSPARRDIEVAQFRLPGGPSMLISTECGGEGRNFEFCTRLVLFDLPWDPMVVEQRIGRLDRIGRDRPVEVRWFLPPSGVGRTVARLVEGLGLFEEPLGGLERELALVPPALEHAVARGQDALPPDTVERILGETRAARERVRDAAYRELHREPYRSDRAPGILARVPEELEETTEDVVLEALGRLGFHVETQRGVATYGVEFGNRATVESLPGVPGGSHFLGTFDREEAVGNEAIDFFASGHPLVEGLLAHLEDSPRGRVGLLHVRGGDGPPGFGVLALYREGRRLVADAVDLEGRRRPDWARRVLTRPLRSRQVDASTWTRQPGWPALIRKLAADLERRDRPILVAAFRLGD